MRKKSILILTVAALCAFTAGTAAITKREAKANTLPENTTVDMYLLAGQSNAVGYSPKWALNQTFENVWYAGEVNRKLDGTNANATLGDHTTYVNVTAGLGRDNSCIGPEYGMSEVLNDLYAGTDRKAMIVKSAAGGTNLSDNSGGENANFGNWYPRSLWTAVNADPANNAATDPTGVQYYNFVENFKTVYTELKTEGYTPVVKGMVWMQGCSDVGGVSNYDELLKTLISDVRSDIFAVTGREADRTVPFIIGEIPVGINPSAKVPAFNELQRKAASESEEAYTVATDGLEIGSDGWHFTSSSAEELGKRFGKRLTETIKSDIDFYVRGASVRAVDDEYGPGIKFHVVMGKADYDALKEKGNLRTGTLICPAAKLGTWETLTVETAAAKDIDTTDAWRETQIDGVSVMESVVYVYDIPASNYGSDLYAVGYYCEGEGDARYSRRIAPVSMSWVAKTEYYDENSSLTTEQKTSLKNTYVDFTVTYTLDGEILETTTAEYGSSLTKPDIQDKSGYHFSGWQNKNGTAAWNFETDTVKGNTSLYGNFLRMVNVTGNYEYTSGRYAGGKITNPDDKVTVTSGKYEGIVDTETQTYSISVPEGTNELTFTSELFQSVKTTVEATEGATAEEVVFSHVLLEDISDKAVNPAVEVENGYAVWSKKNVAIKGAVAEEGFVLNYVLAGTSSTDWYYRGFIGVTLDNGTNHSMSFITSSGKLSLAWNNSATTYNSSTAYKNLGYADVKTEDLKVTLVYYRNVYYFFLNDEYACKVSERADLNQYTGYFSPDALTDGIRTLSLSTVNITSTYKNISYKLGDEIALETVRSIPVNITGEDAMTLNVGYGTKNSSAFVITAYPDYTVTVAGNEKITWEETTKSLRIEEGLPIGTYPVTITVDNGSLQKTIDFTLTVKEIPMVTLTGSYSYLSGTEMSGKIINPNDTVTVTSGEYTGTVDAAAQTYSIRVPEGTSAELTFTSAMFCDVVKEVSAEEDGTAENVQFTVPKLNSYAGVTKLDNGVKLATSVKNTGAVQLAGVTAEEGFVMTYTLDGTTGSEWFYRAYIGIKVEGGVNHAFTFMTTGGKLALSAHQTHNVKVGNQGYVQLGVSDAKAESLTVTMVYYDGAYYFFVKDQVVQFAGWASLNTNTTYEFRTGGDTKSNDPTMYRSGRRTLFLMAGERACSVTDISYQLGNEIAEKFLEGKCFFFEQGHSLSLETGYTETDYVLAITPPSADTVYNTTCQNTSSAANGKLTWDTETKTLHIAKGLAAGEYIARIKISYADYVQYVEIIVTVK